VGGGPKFRLSLRELIAQLEARLKKPIPFSTAATRLGDQPVFYCNIDRAQEDLGWSPRVGPAEGVEKLVSWVLDNREEVGTFLTRKGLKVTA
jgi:CDP-paratose 2-epimerase